MPFTRQKKEGKTTMKLNLKRFLALALSACMLLSATACGSSEQGSTSGEYKTELNIAINANPPSLDVPAVNSNIVGGIGMHIYEPLFALNQDAQPTAVLAESYEVSSDGKTYTIKIREGVKFHNGQELTADDVVASMTRWLEKSSKAAPLLGGSTFAKVDDHTITMTMPEAYSDALSVLAGNIQWAAIMPASVVEAATEEGISEYIGTGPYKLAEWKQDQYVHLTKYDEYQQPEGESSGFTGKKEAATKDLYFRIVTDSTTRVAGVQTGEYDIVEGVSSEQYADLTTDENVALYTKTAGTLNLFFNTTVGIMANEGVRDAIMMALNCDEISLGAYGDENLYVVNPGWCNPADAQWGTEAGSEVYNKGDAEGAKKAAAAAGYKGEEIVLVTTPDYPEMYNATLVVSQQLIEAGFNAVVKESDFATFMERRADVNQFSLFITSNSYNLSPVQLAVVGQAWAGLDAPEVAEGLSAIRLAASAEDSRAAWEDLQSFLYEYGAACVLGHYSGVIASGAEVEGFNYFNFPVYWNVKVPA